MFPDCIIMHALCKNYANYAKIMQIMQVSKNYANYASPTLLMNVLSDLALSFARNIGTRKNNLLCLFERLPVKDVVVVGMEITGSFFSQLKKINEPE